MVMYKLTSAAASVSAGSLLSGAMQLSIYTANWSWLNDWKREQEINIEYFSMGDRCVSYLANIKHVWPLVREQALG